jgi:colanic acid/amylovoran biosynthesis glycosyltransferase
MKAEEPQAGKRPIAYLLTDFPFVSHTFIHDEIAHLVDNGVAVAPIAINTVRDYDKMDDASRQWVAKTTYLKAGSRLAALWTFAGYVWRHPTILAIPLRVGGFDAKAYLWRCFYLVEAVLVVDAMKDSGARHVHAHFGGVPSTLAWFASQVGNCVEPDMPWTWSVTIHGWHEFANENEAMLRPKIAAAEFVVCISEFTRSQLYRLCAPAEWSKISVVRCGVDLQRFTPRTEVSAHVVPRIAIVARVSPEKGHLILVEALGLLRSKVGTVAVDAIGPDANGFTEVVRRRAEELGVSDLITFHGSAVPARVAELLAEVDVFCLPTFAEGLPVVIMEAMARGVPVVTTYIAGIPELAVDGETAAVVPAGDVRLLADALARVLVDDTFRHRITGRAADRVRERHDIRKNVKALAALFGSLHDDESSGRSGAQQGL